MATSLILDIKLANLSRDFSFSRYLDGRLKSATNTANTRILNDLGQLLDPIHCVTLGLAEECRNLCRGGVYHLKLRQDVDYGHPCDIVFINEDWSEYDCVVWDGMTWKERLNLLIAGDNIVPGEDVVPICARILGYGHDPPISSTKPKVIPQREKHCSNLPESDDSETLSSSSLRTKTTASSVISDPATKFGGKAYSRPIEDMSSVLVLYDNIESPPFVCRSRAAEHEAFCKRFPTPRDLSETFIRDDELLLRELTDAEKTDGSEVTVRAARLVLDGRLRTTSDVISRLLETWNDDSPLAIKDGSNFGPLKYMWGELMNRIDTDRALRDISRMDFWPK